MVEDTKRFEPLRSKSDSSDRDIYDGKYHDIICRVNYIYDWTKSRGGDYMMTIGVTDTSSKRLFLKIFNSKPKHFELKINDNVTVKNVKFFRDDLFIVKNPVQIDLLNRNTLFAKKETLEIKDISSSRFINFSGLVIHKQRELPNLVMLYMIDYTRNSRITHKTNRGRYSNDMILHVKVWDFQRDTLSDIAIGGYYKLENLKVHIEENSMYGNLSNKEESKIERIRDPKVLEMFEKRKKVYWDHSNRFYEQIHKDISSISSEGFYKIRIKIIGHTPMKGFTVVGCKECSRSSLDSNYETCKCPDSSKFHMQVMKLLGEDESGRQIFLCKNDICQLVIERLQMNLDSLECLVFTKKMKEGFVHEIRDIM